MTGRTYLFNYEQQRDSGTPNTMEEGVRSPAGQPDAAAGGGGPCLHRSRVALWKRQKRDQEAKSGESLREIHSGNASVPSALPERVGILA